MYLGLIAEADAALADNTRVRIEAAELRARSRTLRIRNLHRLLRIRGGSDADDRDRVHVLLRDFRAAGGGRPRSYVGYSKGSVCQACGATIKAGDLEYDLVTTTGELRLDAKCYVMVIDIQRPTPGPVA